MLLIPWLFAIAFAIADEVVVSLLLRHEYRNFRSAWEADGRPRGMCWIPQEARVGGWYITYASGHAGQRARWRWLFKNPAWMNEDVYGRVPMLLHRIFLPAFWICAILPFVIAALVQRGFSIDRWTLF